MTSLTSLRTYVINKADVRRYAVSSYGKSGEQGVMVSRKHVALDVQIRNSVWRDICPESRTILNCEHCNAYH